MNGHENNITMSAHSVWLERKNTNSIESLIEKIQFQKCFGQKICYSRKNMKT